ncbi:MAG: hypothetical protein MUD08_13495 [Cytophagales bacterium]|jgi:hypothetical protein|nr:hypothetical protein [Cytophagales bacterium]
MEILVFKTNLSRRKLKQVSNALDQTRHLLHWHVDFADCDKVLRVEGQNLSPQKIIDNLNKMGVFCEELL